LNILFANNKMRKECNSDTLLRQRYGAEWAKSIQRRLTQAQAAENLYELQCLSVGNWHPLTANLAGQWAASISHNYRLVFEPADDPLPTLADGGLDTRRIHTIRILEIEDYHHGHS